MKKPRYTDSQIMTILKQAEGGTPVSQLCQEHGMSSASCLTSALMAQILVCAKREFAHLLLIDIKLQLCGIASADVR